VRELGFLERIEEINPEQKSEIAFVEYLDEASAKAWVKWARGEEKKRKRAEKSHGLTGKRGKKETEITQVHLALQST
jgi:hypothetical protein